MDEDEKTKLKKIVKELESHRGRHTELITVYVPKDYNLNMVAKQLEMEKSTAQNIKSSATRNNVMDALERLTRHLKLYKQTPKNGLALFCGNISETEGQQYIEIWAIEPPKELKTKLYRCDQEFVLEPLKNMLEVSKVFGLIVIEKKEATIGLLEGKEIRVLQKMTSGVPGKFKTGGQSQTRFERVRESMALEFYKRVSEAAKEQFFDMREKMEGILVGGPGPTKEEFVRDSELVTALKNKIIAIKDIGYSDEHGLSLLVESSGDVLHEHEITKEKVIVQKFFESLATKPEITTYGKGSVKVAMERGAVQLLLLSSGLEEEDINELKKMAQQIGSEVHVISEQTQEGIQFRNLGGVGAILRFRIN